MEEELHGNSLWCGVCVLCACMCACMCVLCVRDVYIQRCRHAPKHTHIHILMQRLMCVEVWNIIVMKQNVQELNKNEQTPDVVREMPCRVQDYFCFLVLNPHK